MSGLADFRHPHGALATALWHAGVPASTAEAEAGFMYHCMRKPGRESVRACINVYQMMPILSRASLVAEAFAHRVSRHGFQYILADAWSAESWYTREAAGSRERLVAWFRYADFRDVSLPFLKRWTGLFSLPETFTVWRGGQGPAELIADGMSWSLSRSRAAAYALRELDRSQGAPIVLRRQVSRAEALIAYPVDHEVVLAEPGPYAVDTAEAAEIESLFESIKDELDREVAEGQALIATVAADPEKELFAGWEG